MDLPAGTVTFLLTDVEGSTGALVAAPGPTSEALRRIDSAIGEVAAAHSGARPLDQGEGDSAVVAFGSAVDAARAASELQALLAAEPVRVRAAIHTCEARPENGRYSGLALHRCGRLRDVAHGGQVLVSQATYELVRDEIPVVDLGTHRLRDLGGPERIYQLDLGDEFPPLRSLDEIPNNLPAQPTSFVGRAEELDEIVELLAANRVVSIVGSGGCGKSRLALQAAALLADRFEDGMWWVDLAGVADPTLLPAAVRGVLRVPEDGGDALMRYLRARHLCLVLDNCEHLLDVAADFVRVALAAAPGLSVVTTTREPLGLPGEASWRLPSMTPQDAAALFVERARLVQRGFSADEHVATICRRLDGIPLAIELAASRMRAMSPAEVAQGLDDRFRLLTGGPRGVAPRQRTLEASVAWSHDLLADVDKIVLRRLSVFAGGFSRDGAEAVAGSDVTDELTSLVDRSLLVTEPFGDQTRYRMLETIRQYAYERLQESGETSEVRDRHLAYYESLAARAAEAFESRERDSWLARLRADYDNLRAALEWSASSPSDDTWIRIVALLGFFWVYTGDYREALSWTGRALDRTIGDRSPTRLDLLRADAWVAGSFPDFARHDSAVGEGLELAQELGDERAYGRLLAMRAYALLFSDLDAGRAGYEEALVISRRVGDDTNIAFCAGMLSNSWFQQDRFATALACLDEADAAIVRGGDWQHRVMVLVGRSWIAHLQGDLDAAGRYADEAIPLSATYSNPLTQTVVVAAHAWVLARRGQLDDAIARLEDRLHTSAEAGVELAIPWLQMSLTDALLWAGRAEDAIALVERFMPAFEAVYPRLGACAPGAWLGEALARRGDTHRAREVLRDAVARAEEFPRVRAGAYAALARIEPDAAKAEDLVHKALDIRHRYGINVELPATFEQLAHYAADNDSDAEAARLVGAAAAARARIGNPVAPVDRAEYDALVARLRGLPEWAEGEALSLDEAVAYATRARGARGRPSFGWASLTPTELDVVRLAAQGLSNPQIGEKLFISRATVKTHLSHIYSKLSISSRAELAAEAARRTED